MKLITLDRTNKALPEAATQFFWIGESHFLVTGNDNVVVVATECALLGAKGFSNLSLHAISLYGRAPCLQGDA